MGSSIALDIQRRLSHVSLCLWCQCGDVVLLHCAIAEDATNSLFSERRRTWHPPFSRGTSDLRGHESKLYKSC